MSWLALYFRFSGRINRKTYWLAGVIPCTAILLILLSLTLLLSSQSGGWRTLASILSVPTLLYYSSFAFWIYPALTVKRFHDTERSAWHLLLPLIPLIGAIVFLLLTLDSGTSGDNRYGPDPGPGVRKQSSV